MKRRDFLTAAGDLIEGDRHESYGSARENFESIASGWSVILGRTVTAEQVALMMAWLKIARAAHKPKADNWIDAIGYLALGGEISDMED